MSSQLKGTGVALVTPFRADHTIDFRSLERLLQHTTENGVDYFVVLGTTGEPATLSPEEKSAVLAFIKANNPSKLPIVYGFGGNATDHMVNELKHLDLEGISALLSVSPYYNKPSQEGIKKHYEKLANHSPAPIIMYNVPGRTSSNLTAETTLHLAAHPNIIGIKEASGDIAQAMKIAADKPEDFILISGDDLLTLPLLSIGAEGVISVLANAIPQVFRKIFDAVKEDKWKEASQASYRMLKLHPLMYEEGSPSGIKFLLSEMDICGPAVRLPMTQVSDALANRIKKARDVSN